MNLERAILIVLLGAPGGRALTGQVIRNFLPGVIGGEQTLADVNAALTRLENHQPPHVRGTKNEDLGTVWMITDEGRLRVQ